MESLFSFPVGLFHPLQHAGLSRRTPVCRLSIQKRSKDGPLEKALAPLPTFWPRCSSSSETDLDIRVHRPRDKKIIGIIVPFEQ